MDKETKSRIEDIETSVRNLKDIINRMIESNLLKIKRT